MSKRTDKIRKKLADGEVCSGIFFYLASPMAAEIMADTGFDFVVVDAEHLPFNPETLLHILLAFKGSDTVPMIRVPWNDPVMIKQALDMGYEGIITPQTNTVKEAQKAVAACRYPPVGTRGYGPTRPTDYYKDNGKYVRTANESIICAIQIENVSGAHDIENIVKVPGIDWILLGRYDMSASVGNFCDVEHPDLRKAIKKIMDAANEAGVPAGGLPLGERPELTQKIVFVGTDFSFLQSAADSALKTFRETVRKKP